MSGDGAGSSVVVLILMNIVCSVSIVTVNKLLVESYGFKFVLLLSSLHFGTGYAFLRFASSDSCKLFTRAEAPRDTINRLALAGAGSIALLNYSLRLNSVGTYQIFKVAVLPAVMALSTAQHIMSPSRKEVGAAGLVMVGTLVCAVSDVWMTLLGLGVGVAAVVSTAQYQIWQGTVQKENGLNSTQALYLMSLPQAWMTLAASIVLETDWSRVLGRASAAMAGGASADGAVVDGDAAAAAAGFADDIWSHPYTFAEVGLILLTCVFAVMLNYSTIGVIGKTSAVTMQFVNQVKTVLTITMGFIMFPKPTPPERIAAMVAGLATVLLGVAWYTRIKSVQAAAK